MDLAVALTILQFIITMLFCPIRVGARGHASLARDKLELDLIMLGLSVAKVRVKRKERAFVLNINGKPLKKEKKMSPKQLTSLAKQYQIEGIRASGNLLALISADDAKNTAIAYAVLTGILQPLIHNVRIYTANPSDTFEIDGRIKLKINIVQIAGLIVAGIGNQK